MCIRDRSEAELTKVMRIMIICLAIIAMSVAAFLPPILAAMNWLFSWLVPVFWVVVFGLFWKRNATVAMATLISAWVANSVWSFSSISSVMGLPADINPYVTLVATLIVGVIGNLAMDGEPGFFKSEEYKLRVAQQAASEA